MSNAVVICPDCGAVVNSSGPLHGLCPRCMLLSNFGAEAAAVSVPDGAGQIPERIIDQKYRLERPLGRGGMGSVFLATHLGTGRQVAVKLVSHESGGTSDFQKRFRREAMALGRLRHPNVVNITDFGVAPGPGGDNTAYIVMEYLVGQTLAAYQKEHRTVPVHTMLDILDQVAAALDAAHQAGIIHRDLKPENIWLEPSPNGRFIVKVLDFGIAKISDPASAAATRAAADDSSTRTLEIIPTANAFMLAAATVRGSTVGTPAYMSPEQCRGEPLDGRSDIYSLGVVTYSLVCGELPFSGTSAELLQMHVHAPPPPVGSKREGISRVFSDAVMSALEKKPEHRPLTAAAFASRLRTAAELESRLLQRSRTLASISPFVSFGQMCLHLLLAVPLGALALHALFLSGLTPPLRDGLAFVTIVAIFMVTANLSKASWALIAKQRLDPGAQGVRMKDVARQLLRALPDLLLIQLVVLVRYPVAHGTGLWPVVCVIEKREAAQAVKRSLALTWRAGPQMRALFIRKVGLAVVGAAYGLLVTPVLATDNFAEPEFLVFQSFCAYIISVPWAMTTLAAYTMAYFHCRQLEGEAPEPVINEFVSPDYRDRIPALSRQSKLWLACIAATSIVSIYIYSSNEIFEAGRRGERLIKAGEQGRIAAMNELLAANVNPDSVIGGWSPLTRAVLFGQERAVDVLLAAGVDVNRNERHIGSALYLAVAGRREHLARKLLDHGADPDAAPNWGQTPLMVAATQGNEDLVRLLLDRGADAGRRSRDGQLASALARREGHLEIAELLERAEKR